MKKKFFFCVFLLSVQSFLIKAQSKIPFSVDAPVAKNGSESSLYLAGNFNGWQVADAAWKLKRVKQYDSQRVRD